MSACTNIFLKQGGYTEDKLGTYSACHLSLLFTLLMIVTIKAIISPTKDTINNMIAELSSGLLTIRKKDNLPDRIAAAIAIIMEKTTIGVNLIIGVEPCAFGER